MVILLQVFNVPLPGESLSVYGLQGVASLSRVVDDSVESFPCGAKLSLGWISGRNSNLAQNQIPYIKSSELYPLIVVFHHLQLILRHSDESLFSYFVQTVQALPQMIAITLFVECLSPNTGHSYFNRDHGFSAIGEFEGGFSR